MDRVFPKVIRQLNQAANETAIVELTDLHEHHIYGFFVVLGALLHDMP